MKPTRTADKTDLLLFDLTAWLGIAILPDLLTFGEPFWSRQRLPDGLLVCLAYTLARRVSSYAGRPLARVALAAVTLAVSGLVIAAGTLLYPEFPVSRMATLMALGLALLAASAAEAPAPGRTTFAAAVVGTLAVSIWLALERPAAESPSSATSTRTTVLHTIVVTDHGPLISESDAGPGGGLATAGRDVLAITGLGGLYKLSPSDVGVTAARLPLESPLEAAVFSRFQGPRDYGFRVQDLAVRQAAATWLVVASHHVWDATRGCTSMAVSTAELTSSLSEVVRGWTEAVRLNSCLPMGGTTRGLPFVGMESGGRLAWLGPNQLIMTTGDHQFDGVNRNEAVAQDSGNDFGKTLIIDLDTGRVRPFTKGHRNPQGLTIDGAGRIWSTEHGPQGGDELNLLRQGGNYGWPFATYGTDYYQPEWPGLRPPPAGEEFVDPVFSWTPSIGISNLITLSGTRFPRWRGDLLIGSLASRTLYRVRLHDDQIAYAEPIRIGFAIRDLVETASGDIWTWDDAGRVVVISPATMDDRGAEIFAACARCHTIDESRVGGGLAPNLLGVLDRPVANDPEFPHYTQALRGVGGRWTPERLDAFLQNPAAFAPGTSMTSGVPDAADRAAVIAFLAARP